MKLSTRCIAGIMSVYGLFLSLDISAQTLILNEVMSSNSIIFDEDGNANDWIEIKNIGSDTINLQGWGISDDLDELNKWTFPDCIIAPNEYELVWASGEDKKTQLFAQAIIDQGDEFKYLVPEETVPDDWVALNFDDSSWSVGPSSIGFNDNDDATVISNQATSVFARRIFEIDNADDYSGLFFRIDYDDGYVAYLNGVEIARRGMTGEFPAFDVPADSVTEALLYRNKTPEEIEIENFQDLLRTGENVLAVQVHDISESLGGDITMVPFLSGFSKTDKFPDPFYKFFMEDQYLHSNFKVSSDSETVFLSEPSGNIIDQVLVENIPTGVSYGRDEDLNWVMFANPTLRKKNDNFGSTELVESEVDFSIDGGISGPIDLALSGAEAPAIIRFTTDGTAPTTSSQIYSEPIQITENTVVRARIYNDGFIPSKTYTESYLVNVNHELPVMSIAIDPEHFLGSDHGIYALGNMYYTQWPHIGANYFEDWERPSHISFFDTNGSVFKQNIGLKIHGNLTRGFVQKSLGLIAKDKYDGSLMNYQFFPDVANENHKSLILRNSGNDFNKTMFRDGLQRQLVHDGDLETQGFRQIVVYVNGEYWGIHNIREKTSEHYVSNKYDIDTDDIDLIKFESFTVTGSNEEYLDLLNFIELNSLEDTSNFAFVSEQMDVDNFIYYQLSEIFFNNTDWPGNNIKYWKTEDTKWRWIMYDLDFGFGGRHPDSYDVNTFAFALEENGSNWPNPPWSTFLFRNLVKNQDFTHKFINQFADELNTRFLPERILPQIDSLANMIASEIPRQYERWEHNDFTLEGWEDRVDIMRVFGEERGFYCKEHMLTQFQLPAYHQIDVQNTNVSAGAIELNSLLLEQENWSGDYFQDVPITLTAKPQLGYAFVRWEGDVDSDQLTISINMEEEMSVSAVWEEIDGLDPSLLVINEINYKSADGVESGDWVEIYNGNALDVDVSNWKFKDANDNHEYELPMGTVIGADDFLIIAQDQNSFTQVLCSECKVVGDFDFGLGVDDEIRLYTDLNQLVDSVHYLSVSPWPTQPNGEGRTLELINPSYDNTLPQSWEGSEEFGSPGMHNRSVVSTEELASENYFAIQPNLFEDEIFIRTIKLIEGTFNLELFNGDGKIVKSKQTQFRGDNQEVLFKTSSLSKGVYYLKITNQIGRVEVFRAIKI